jgi:hypothetical protein
VLIAARFIHLPPSRLFAFYSPPLATEVWNVSLSSASSLSISDAGLIAPSIGNVLLSAQIESVSIGTLSAAPLPAALPLFAGGLGVMGWLTTRRKRKAGAQAVAWLSVSLGFPKLRMLTGG